MSTTTTAGAVIRAAFKHCGALGIGQALGGDMLAEGLDRLKLMLGTLSMSPQMAYTRTVTVVTVPGGVASRTIGPSMQIDCARPWRIEPQSFVRVDGHDYPLEVLTQQQYNAISDKALDGPWPRACWFDGGDPTGVLYLWPMGACALHLVTLAPVATVVNATATLVLPDGFEDALGYMLAQRLAPFLEVTLRDDVRAMAVNGQRLIKRATHEVPQLTHETRADDTTSQLFGL